MKCELCDGDTSGTIALMVGGPFVLLLAGLLMYFCCSCCKADDEKDDNRALALADDLGEGRGRSLSRGMSSMSVAVAKKTKRAASIFALLNAPFRILLA